MITLNSETDLKKANPFLRWTGSKSWLVRSGVDHFIPQKFNKYHEPFIGGGSLLFYLQPNTSQINDLNEELVNTYIQVQQNVDKVITYLYKLKNTKEEYYKIRNKKYKTAEARAARFIYLNRTSFNGIYRVNPRGEYNVPYGYRKNVDIITEENLRLVSNFLINVKITNHDFYVATNDVKKGDFVYLDPPYTVAHENNGFIEYNSKLFSWDDQIKLAETVREIAAKEAFFVLSNAEHTSIRELYRGLGEIHTLSRYSKVGGRNKTRGIFNEVIITNVK